MPIPYRNQRIIRANPPIVTQLFNRKSVTYNGLNEYTLHGDVLGFEYDDAWSAC